jgi:hypothetical protein
LPHSYKPQRRTFLVLINGLRYKLLFNGLSDTISSVLAHNLYGKIEHSSNGNQSEFNLSNNIVGYDFISTMQNLELIHLKLILDNEISF